MRLVLGGLFAALHLYGIREYVNAARQSIARIHIVLKLLGHLFLLRGTRRSGPSMVIVRLVSVS